MAAIDWDRLLREFEHFEPDDEILEFDALLFERSLIDPIPDFVCRLLEKERRSAGNRAVAVRALYAFLLEKRYQERLNLLHFAFRVFEETTHLPQAMIDRTPFPHEEGLPSFRHINDPSYHLSLTS